MKSTRRTEFETGQPTLPQPQPENWNLVAVTKHSKWKNKFGKKPRSSTYACQEFICANLPEKLDIELFY